MFSRREGLDIVTLTVAPTVDEAEEIVEMLGAAGIRSVIRTAEEERDLLIVSDESGAGGAGVLINSADAERAVSLMYEAGYFHETEEFTDEELEELAMSMEEITGLEEDEPDENDERVRSWFRR